MQRVENGYMRVCIIPAFRATGSIARVVSSVLPFVDRIIVVDDGCSDGTGDVAKAAFAHDSRVEIINASVNRGVGGAMKLGIAVALSAGATLIVKVDADDQMDARYIPDMFRILDANPKIALVKGNRFNDGVVVRVMPTARLIGNSILTLLARISTGYWNGVDPTNGFFAIRASAIERINVDHLANRYYFEISLLAALGLRRAVIAEMEMPPIYGKFPSSLSILRTILTFPIHLVSSLVKRIVWQYFVADMNVGSLLLVVGAFLWTLAAVLGSMWWSMALHTGIPTTPGNASIVIAPLIMGSQLFLNAILYDVQFSSRVVKIMREDLNASIGFSSSVQADGLSAVH